MAITPNYSPTRAGSILSLYVYINKKNSGWVAGQLNKIRALYPYEQESPADPRFLFALEELITSYKNEFGEDPNFAQIEKAFSQKEESAAMSAVDRDQVLALVEEAEAAKQKAAEARRTTHQKTEGWLRKLAAERGRPVSDTDISEAAEKIAGLDSVGADFAKQVLTASKKTTLTLFEDDIKHLESELEKERRQYITEKAKTENTAFFAAENPRAAAKIFEGILRDTPGVPNRAEIGSTRLRAIGFSDASAALTADINPEKQAEISEEFIRSSAKIGARGAVETLLKTLPPEEKNRIAAALAARGVEAVLKDKNKLAEIFGSQVVGTDRFRTFLTQGAGALRREYSQNTPSGGSSFARFAGQLLTGPASRFFLKNPEQAAQTTLSALSLPGRFPSLAGFIPIPGLSGSSSPFTTLFLNRIQVVHIKQVAADVFWSLVKRGTVAVSEKVKTGLFTRVVAAVGTRSVSGGLFKITGGLLTKFALTALNPLWGFAIGFVGAPLIKKAFGKIWEKLSTGAIIGKVGAVVGGISEMLGQAKAPPAKKQPGFWPTIAVVGVITLMAFPALSSSFSLGGSSYNVEVTQSAFVSNVGGAEEPGSKYIQLTKSPSPPSFPNNNPGTVIYSITITAVDRPLTNIGITDEATVFSEKEPYKLILPDPPAVSEIEAGSTYSYSYSYVLPADIKDAVVSNLITVTADAGDLSGEYKTTSASVIIGNPPTGCFIPGPAGVAAGGICQGVSTDWNTNEWNTMITAISQLSKSPAYMAKICSNNSSVNVYRMPMSWGGGCHSSGNVYIYNGGISSYRSALYTVAHESGHVLNFRDAGYYNRFVEEEISAHEGMLPTYPNTLTVPEDFAETFAVYVANGIYPLPWGGKSYPKDFPEHCRFARDTFGGTVFQTECL